MERKNVRKIVIFHCHSIHVKFKLHKLLPHGIFNDVNVLYFMLHHRKSKD